MDFRIYSKKMENLLPRLHFKQFPWKTNGAARGIVISCRSLKAAALLHHQTDVYVTKECFTARSSLNGSTYSTAPGCHSVSMLMESLETHSETETHENSLLEKK